MDKLRSLITAIFSACFSLIVIPLYEYFVTINMNLLLSVIVLLVTTSIATIINYFFIPRLLYSLKAVRRVIDPLARYEGFWMHYIYPEDSNDERACGIVSFNYDRYEKCYLFSGENYSAEGKIISSFQVRNINFDKQINGFRYWGLVKEQENAAFSCYGELSFAETGTVLIQSANGMFINNSKSFVRAKYHTERICLNPQKPYTIPIGLETIQSRANYASKKYKEYISLSN